MNDKDRELMKKIEKITDKAVGRGWDKNSFDDITKFLKSSELSKYHYLNIELKGRLEKEMELLQKPDSKLSRVELRPRGEKLSRIFENVSGVFMEEGHLIIEMKKEKETFCDVCHLSEINYWREIHV